MELSLRRKQIMEQERAMVERELKRERLLALSNKDLDFRGGSIKQMQRKQFNKSLLSRMAGASREEPYRGKP